MHMNVVVGKDVIKPFTPKERKKWFHNESYRYDEFYEAEDGTEYHITEFRGDEYFTSREDLMAFAGGDWCDFDLIDDSFEVWVKRYYSFGEKDVEYWKDKAKDFAHQLRFRPSEGYRMKDFGL